MIHITYKLTRAALVMLGLVALYGCTKSADDGAVTVRVKEMRCSDGFKQNQIPECKGAVTESTTYDFRVRPSSTKVFVRTVKQDMERPSDSLFELDGCLVWDTKNWKCEHMDSTIGVTYMMVDGHYAHQVLAWNLNSKSNDYYVGDAQVVGRSFVDRVRSFF